MSTDGRSKGGHARAAALSPERRAEIARAGAKARWAKAGTARSSTGTAPKAKRKPAPKVIAPTIREDGFLFRFLVTESLADTGRVNAFIAGCKTIDDIRVALRVLKRVVDDGIGNVVGRV